MALDELVETVRPLLADTGTTIALGAAAYTAAAAAVGRLSNRTTIGEQMRGGTLPILAAGAAIGTAIAQEVQTPAMIEVPMRYLGVAAWGAGAGAPAYHIGRSALSRQYNVLDNIPENSRVGAALGAALVPVAYWFLTTGASYFQ